MQWRFSDLPICRLGGAAGGRANERTTGTGPWETTKGRNDETTRGGNTGEPKADQRHAGGGARPRRRDEPGTDQEPAARLEAAPPKSGRRMRRGGAGNRTAEQTTRGRGETTKGRNDETTKGGKTGGPWTSQKLAGGWESGTEGAERIGGEGVCGGAVDFCLDLEGEGRRNGNAGAEIAAARCVNGLSSANPKKRRKTQHQVMQEKEDHKMQGKSKKVRRSLACGGGNGYGGTDFGAKEGQGLWTTCGQLGRRNGRREPPEAI